MAAIGALGHSFGSDDSFSGDDEKAFVTFKGCMESKIASARRGTVKGPFNQQFGVNKVEKSL